MVEQTTQYTLLGSRLNTDYVPGTNTKTNSSGEAESQTKNIILSFDVVTKFSNDLSGDLTKYPVSQGSDVTDHITIRNRKFSLTGIVSNTPFETHHGEYMSNYGTGSNRVREAINMLKDIFENKRLFSLYSEYEKIDNCVLTGLKFDQEGQEAVEFELSVEQARLAFAKQVTLNVSGKTKKSVSSNTNGGGSTKSALSQQEQGSYVKKKEVIIKDLNKGA